MSNLSKSIRVCLNESFESGHKLILKSVCILMHLLTVLVSFILNNFTVIVFIHSLINIGASRFHKPLFHKRFFVAKEGKKEMVL